MCPKGLYTLCDLYNIWLSGGSLGSAPSSYQILLFWLLKYGPTASEIAKNRNFWYKFPKFPYWKIGGGCTTTNLPLCNYAITVLKITPLHSVITNFVIPKRDKKTRNQYASPLPGNAIPAGPLSDFICKVRRGVGCPRSVASRQTSRLWL